MPYDPEDPSRKAEDQPYLHDPTLHRPFAYTYDNQTMRFNASENYYPITSEISFIGTMNNAISGASHDQGSYLKLSILPTRCQGGTVLEDGTIELMQHRRLFSNDGLGMGEVIDDVDPSTYRGIEDWAEYYLVLEEFDG